TVPHAHFHIIPRPPLDQMTSSKMSWVMFGRGQRHELNDEDGQKLANQLRIELAKEVTRIKETEGIDLDTDCLEDAANVPRPEKL
ncbi:hypothetical protein PRK78_006180, partial [Emydomyces testavorans]